MVQNEINNNTNLDFSCKTVELEYLSSWPKISLSIKDGELSIGDNNSDSISSIDVKFKKVFSTTDLSDIIIEKKLNLSTITVESPKIDIIINKNKPQIILNRKNIKKSENTIQLNINKLLVNNGVIKVKDNITKNDLSFNNTNVILDGIVNSSNGDFTLFTECKNVEVRNKNFNNDFNFTVNCKCLTPNKYNDIKIKEAELL
ncbi:AsmA family protein, partial [Bacteroides caecigallinarum]